MCQIFGATLYTSSSLRITDRSFRYVSPCLWNQLPAVSLRQPRISSSVSDSFFTNLHLLIHRSPHPYPPHFHWRFVTYLFQKSFSPDTFPPSGLNLRTPDRTISPEHICFCFSFFFLFFCFMSGSMRYTKLASVSLRSHKIVYRIVQYHMFYRSAHMHRICRTR